MATMNRTVVSERPTTLGSWDDLINRNRGRRDSLGQKRALENTMRSPAKDNGWDPAMNGRVRGPMPRRPQSSGGDFAKGRANGLVNESPASMKPRTTTPYHPERRTSLPLVAPAAVAQRNPSPLRNMKSSDPSPGTSSNHVSPELINKNNTEGKPETIQQGAMKRPSMYARPQRLSNSSNATEAGERSRAGSFQSFDSVIGAEGRMRAADGGGPSSYDEGMPFPSFPQPTLGAWHRRSEMVRRARPSTPGPNELFEKLPSEVLRLILDHLKRLHAEKGTGSCATCWMRDCCSISMGNKKWLHAARAALYEDIQLVGPDSAQQRKKYKVVYTTRLVLLRRSLRADSKLAEMVRSIKVPALPDDAPIEAGAYHDIVASVVKACPNLERLDGFHPSYNHGDSRLFNALTSKEKLKEMTWVIDAMPSDFGHHGQKSHPSRSRNRLSAADSFSKLHSNPYSYLTAQLANKFVRHHMNWTDLSHLTIHCLPGANLRTPNGLLNIVLTYLPSLQSLYLSHVPAQSFDDSHLLDLPRRLKKLSISHCSGITATGLSTFATHSSAQDLETLTLIHQSLDSLPAIVRILSNLHNLTTFNLVQSLAPALPDDTFAIWLMPYLASNSLKNLHWDIFESETYGVTKADDILARSITANGFPSLRVLRVPCDPDGLFQALCKPKERVDLPGDRYRNRISLANQTTPTTRPNAGGKINGAQKAPPSSSSYNVSGVDFVVATDLSSESRLSSDTNSKDSGKFLSAPAREAGSDLHAARRAAQARLEAARQFPRIEANITDENGVLIESSGLAGYMGTISSNVNYSLAPDVGGSDDRGGLVGVWDLLGDGGESLFASSGSRGAHEAGYGTGCVPVCVQARELDAAAEGSGKANKLSKSGGGGGGKNASRDKEDGDDSAKRKVNDGCTGRWNAYNNNETFTLERKQSGGEAWQHTERGRWRGRVELS